MQDMRSLRLCTLQICYRKFRRKARHSSARKKPGGRNFDRMSFLQPDDNIARMVNIFCEKRCNFSSADGGTNFAGEVRWE